MNATFEIKSGEDLARLVYHIGNMAHPFTAVVSPGIIKPDRTKEQNNLLHKWFDDIARQTGDRSRDDVKGECNVIYGIPIRSRNEVFAWVWNRVSEPLSHEQQCILLSSRTRDEVLRITSAMTAKELQEYMDCMQRDWGARVKLTDPEAKKYEGEFR